jgi:hypothetical protein
VWHDHTGAGDLPGFSFYLFARASFRPPSVVRLGKKGCPIRLDWQEITGALALFVDNAVRPTHAVNPLDVQGEIVAYEPLPIPPHLIFRVAEIQKDWFVFAGEHIVHVPHRFNVAG